MPSVTVISGNNIVQVVSHNAWVVGDNPIVFPKPFSDITYAFVPTISDILGVTVKEKVGSRTKTGIVVTVTGSATGLGCYVVAGPSDTFPTGGIFILDQSFLGGPDTLG